MPSAPKLDVERGGQIHRGGSPPRALRKSGDFVYINAEILSFFLLVCAEKLYICSSICMGGARAALSTCKKYSENYKRRKILAGMMPSRSKN